MLKNLRTRPTSAVRAADDGNHSVLKFISLSEFICQDVGIPCPPGVDKDLWQRFEAFEKWNAAH